MKIKYLTIILALFVTNAHAQTNSANMAQDSTFFGTMSATMNSQQATAGAGKTQTINSGAYTAGTMGSPLGNSTKQITYGTCPSGMTFNGSSQYPVSEITVTNYVLNGKVVGTKVSPPVYYNNDCSKTEYQTLSCPAGYSGSIRQSRSVAGSEGDYQYSAWSTISNTCTPPPPPPPPPPPSDPCYSTRWCNMNDALYTWVNGWPTKIPGSDGKGPCLQELGETYCNGRLKTSCNYTVGSCWNWF